MPEPQSQQPRRRKFSPELKGRLVSECSQPGASVSAVALANGLNTNQLRRWIVEYQEGAGWTKRGHHRAGSWYSDEFKREIIRQCLESEASVIDIARQHGIRYRLIYRWIQALAKPKPKPAVPSKPAPVAGLLPVVLDEEALPAKNPAPSHAQSQIDIDMGGAHIQLRGEGQLEALRIILACLRC